MISRIFATTTVVLLSTAVSYSADATAFDDGRFDWSGRYVGVQAGYIEGDVDTSLSVPGNNIIAAATASALAVGSTDLDPSGFTIGIYAGFNEQRDNVVYGIEGDLNYTDVDDTAAVVTPMGLTAARTTDDLEMDFLATIRGRLGLARDNILIYGTGGIAFSDADLDRNLDWAFLDGCPLVAGLQRCHSGGDDFRTGYTVGGGLEYAHDNGYNFKLEYLYVDLGDEEFQTVNSSIPGQNLIHSVDLAFHTVRFGISKPF